MLADREPVGLQIVHGIVKFVDLRGRLVAAADHLVLLSPHDDASVRLRHKREGLGQHQFEWTGQDAIQHAGPCAGRVFLEAQHAGKPGCRLMPNFDRLAPDDDTVGVDRRGDAALRQRHSLAPSANDLMQDLARLGEQHAVLVVQREHARFETLQAGGDIEDLVLKLFEGFFVKLKTTVPGPPEADPAV